MLIKQGFPDIDLFSRLFAAGNNVGKPLFFVRRNISTVLKMIGLIEAEVVNLGKEIERLERQQVIDFELSNATSVALKNNPMIEKAKGNPRATKEYKDAFSRAIRSKHGYEVMNFLKVGEESEGGYLVPDEFERTLVRALEEENVFRS